jgi:hypothetical protein
MEVWEEEELELEELAGGRAGWRAEGVTDR